MDLANRVTALVTNLDNAQKMEDGRGIAFTELSNWEAIERNMLQIMNAAQKPESRQLLTKEEAFGLSDAYEFVKTIRLALQKIVEVPKTSSQSQLQKITGQLKSALPAIQKSFNWFGGHFDQKASAAAISLGDMKNKISSIDAPVPGSDKDVKKIIDQPPPMDPMIWMFPSDPNQYLSLQRTDTIGEQIQNFPSPPFPTPLPPQPHPDPTPSPVPKDVVPPPRIKERVSHDEAPERIAPEVPGQDNKVEVDMAKDKELPQRTQNSSSAQSTPPPDEDRS